AFCRCFAHADRLQSLIGLALLSEKYHGKDSVAFGRDLSTMVWFTVGALRELARAIQSLRGPLHRRGLLEPDSEPWLKLRGLEDRWNGNEFFRKKRDIIAFHIDPEIVDRGLDELVKDNAEVFLSEG